MVQYAKDHSVSSAARHYDITQTEVNRWAKLDFAMLRAEEASVRLPPPFLHTQGEHVHVHACIAKIYSQRHPKYPHSHTHTHTHTHRTHRQTNIQGNSSSSRQDKWALVVALAVGLAGYEGISCNTRAVQLSFQRLSNLFTLPLYLCTQKTKKTKKENEQEAIEWKRSQLAASTVCKAVKGWGQDR